MDQKSMRRAIRERQRMRKRQRIIRMVSNITSAMIVIALVACLIVMELPAIRSQKAEQVTKEEPSTYIETPESAPTRMTTVAEKKLPVVKEETVEYAEDHENEKIEAALIEQAYIRSDIPLDNEIQIVLRAACEEFGIEYELALAVIWKETTFENKMGDSGASYGYMQVQPIWHRARMDSLGVTDLMDPYSNFRVGLHYLAELIDSYDGNVEKALMAYNAGRGGANEHWFSKGIFTNSYSQAVLGKYSELKGGE